MYVKLIVYLVDSLAKAGKILFNKHFKKCLKHHGLRLEEGADATWDEQYFFSEAFNDEDFQRLFYSGVSEKDIDRLKTIFFYSNYENLSDFKEAAQYILFRAQGWYPHQIPHFISGSQEQDGKFHRTARFQDQYVRSSNKIGLINVLNTSIEPIALKLRKGKFSAGQKKLIGLLQISLKERPDHQQAFFDAYEALLEEEVDMDSIMTICFEDDPFEALWRSDEISDVKYYKKFVKTYFINSS